MRSLRPTALLCWLLVFAAVAGCQREEPPPVATPPQKPSLHVVIPDEVRAKWQAVRVVAHDKRDGRDLVYTVDIGSYFTLPDSALRVEVVSFLPAFVTDGRTATSLSNDLRNPGAEIVVRDGEREIYRGWLFREVPEDHGFRHPRYTLALSDFIARR